MQLVYITLLRLEKTHLSLYTLKQNMRKLTYASTQSDQRQ